jgi:hypothetical protein
MSVCALTHNNDDNALIISFARATKRMRENANAAATFALLRFRLFSLSLFAFYLLFFCIIEREATTILFFITNEELLVLLCC